jgi:1,4-alpha-glucan branching enzyme
MTAQASLAGKKRVKFQIQAEKGSEVYIAGTFNNWSAKKNKLAFKDGVYSTSILLPKGRHEYKFVVNGVWCVDPECAEWAPNGLGSLNSVIVAS